MHALLRELCARHHPAVLLVTHDVDEAIELANRVLVLDEGRFVLDLEISLDHGRALRAQRFAAYRDTLLEALGVQPGESRGSLLPDVSAVTIRS